MKKFSLSFLILAMIASIPLGASAQMPDLFLEFDFEGFGNMMLTSPPTYFGDVVSGDPLVLGASWWIEIDDTGWPGTGDPAARWDYIFNNFFEYNAMTGSWTAEFDAGTLATKPTWEINHPVNGLMGGTLVISFTFGDWDLDGTLDLEERMFGTFEGTLLVMKYGTGEFAYYCGSGAYNGSCQNGDPANWADDYVEGHCVMDLVDCFIANEDVTWGSVKQMYKK